MRRGGGAREGKGKEEEGGRGAREGRKRGRERGRERGEREAAHRHREARSEAISSNQPSRRNQDAPASGSALALGARHDESSEVGTRVPFATMRLIMPSSSIHAGGISAHSSSGGCECL